MDTKALLTLNAGSVLQSSDKKPSQVVLKHKCGDVARAQKHSEHISIELRTEDEESFTEVAVHEPLVPAMGTLADQQAFGFRVDGVTVNPYTAPGGYPETIEFEPLNLGAYLFDGLGQLPVAIYTTNEVYYRLYEKWTKEPTNTKVHLDRKTGPRGEWEQIDTAPFDSFGTLIETLADETGMVATDSSTESINEAIQDADDSFRAPASAEEDEIREKAGIQDKTAFPPNHPTPRPVEFPTFE